MFKVMIVDDMEILRRDVRRLKLWGEKSGFIITAEAKDGWDALKKLEAEPVDLVITDIRMPNMDGIELLRRINEQKLCPFTVLLSDYTEYQYARQGFVYGAFDYIGRPVDEKELAELLERIKQKMAEKQQEELKMIELEEMVEDTFFTAADVEQIIELICQGEEKAAVLTAAMVEDVEVSFNYDQKKALLVLKNAVNEITHEILHKHQWIAAYMDIEELKNIDFASCRDWQEIKTVILAAENKLISFIDKFIGHHNNDMVKKACLYVLAHIEEEISVKVLVQKLFISKSYLSDIFKQNLGVSLLEYITMVKMERAKKLLREERLKSYEIAYRLGFQDHEYFSRVFKKYIGLSPTEYRQRKISGEE